MSDQVIVLSPSLTLLPAHSIIVSVGRFNIEDGGQTINLYNAPSGELTVPAGQDALERSALLKLFEHLSGSKNKLTSFILSCDWTDYALVVWLARQQWLLTVENLQRLLGLTSADATDLLSAAITALADLPLFDDMVRSGNRSMIKLRTDVADGRAAFRSVATIPPLP